MYIDICTLTLKKEKHKRSIKRNNEDLLELNEENPWICPFKIWERNIAFPPLADSLEITFDDQVGRHVKATRNINAG